MLACYKLLLTVVCRFMRYFIERTLVYAIMIRLSGHPTPQICGSPVEKFFELTHRNMTGYDACLELLDEQQYKDVFSTYAAEGQIARELVSDLCESLLHVLIALVIVYLLQRLFVSYTVLN